MTRWPTIAALAGVAATLWLVWSLYDALFPVFVGFGLAYAFDPLADRLEKHKVGRTTAVLLILGAVLLTAVVGVGLLVPKLVDEAQAFAQDFPRYAGAAHDRLDAWLAPFGVRLPQNRDALLTRLRDYLQGVSVAALSPIGLYAGRFFSSVAGTLTALLNLVIIPVVFFYFLRDISSIRRSVLNLAPPRMRPSFEARLEEADRVFSGYLRGQMTVALILAVVYSVGLTLAGVRFGVLIGILSGLLNIVPYLGVALGLGTSLIMAAVDFGGWGPLGAVLAVFALAQTLEGFYITPKIVGDKVGLSPVETIVALILGGDLGGLPGMILAIPVAGCLKAWAGDALDAWRRSSYYRSS